MKAFDLIGNQFEIGKRQMTFCILKLATFQLIIKYHTVSFKVSFNYQSDNNFEAKFLKKYFQMDNFFYIEGVRGHSTTTWTKI